LYSKTYVFLGSDRRPFGYGRAGDEPDVVGLTGVAEAVALAGDALAGVILADGVFAVISRTEFYLGIV